MRVIKRAVMDIETGRWEEVEEFEYIGPIANCKGGGSTSTSTTTIDYAYNARMAALSERQQAMAEQYFQFWEQDYKPMEKAQIAANIGLIPSQVGAERAKSELEEAKATAEKGLLPKTTALAEESIGLETEKAQAARGLLGKETEYKRGVLEAGIAETEAATPVMSEYYKQALRGVDPNQRVSQARADVAGAFEGSDAMMARSMGRYGIQMGAEKMTEMARQKAIAQAKATGAAMTGARLGAEEENFQRLSGATSAFKGGLKGI